MNKLEIKETNGSTSYYGNTPNGAYLSEFKFLSDSCTALPEVFRELFISVDRLCEEYFVYHNRNLFNVDAPFHIDQEFAGITIMLGEMLPEPDILWNIITNLSNIASTPADDIKSVGYNLLYNRLMDSVITHLYNEEPKNLPKWYTKNYLKKSNHE